MFWLPRQEAYNFAPKTYLLIRARRALSHISIDSVLKTEEMSVCVCMYVCVCMCVCVCVLVDVTDTFLNSPNFLRDG